MAAKLSTTMATALEKAKANGGKLLRWHGGFWTHPNCPGKQKWGGGATDQIPEWWVDLKTVRALVDRGLMQFTKQQTTYDGSFAVEASIVQPKT